MKVPFRGYPGSRLKVMRLSIMLLRLKVMRIQGYPRGVVSDARPCLRVRTKREQLGRFEDFYLNAKARIRP